VSFCKRITRFMMVTGLVFALPAWGQQKPLTEGQVQTLVRSGLGDESGAKVIEQRGVDFAPGEKFLQSLEAAGASEAFLMALRAAKHPEPAGTKMPLNQVQVFALLGGGVPSHRVTLLIQERGIDFAPTDEYLQEVSLAGGDDELISTLKRTKVTKPVTLDPAAETRQVEVKPHAARGAEFFQEKRYADAEVEYRAAVQLDPQNADLHIALSRALNAQGKADGALAQAREGLRLNPESDLGHFSLGVALGEKGDMNGQIVEYREALRLNPSNELAHNNLGLALGNAGDSEGAIAEYRAALRVNPNDDMVHVNLGSALGNSGDVRGEIAEDREALRLNPQNEDAHVGLGVALGNSGDKDGEIAEERAALRLNPNNALAHNNLGVALEAKGDLRGALEEYHTAYTLDAGNETYGQNYERVSLQLRQR